MRTLLFLLLLSATFPVSGQVTLAHDFNPSPTNPGMPQQLTPYMGKLFLTADDGIHYYELWSVDTLDNAALIGDLNPVAIMGSQLVPNYFAVAGNKLYFTGNSGQVGCEIYQYDGSAITLAVDMYPGTTTSSPTSLTSFNGRLYFIAREPGMGRTLYSLDPLTNSTKIIFQPMSSALARTIMFPFNGKLYFPGFIPGYGIELCTYDPIADTVIRLTDMEPGLGNASPTNFTVLNNMLYYTAWTSAYGYELYSYDSATGATRLSDMAVGSHTGVGQIFAFQNAVFFSGGKNQNHQLYKYVPDENQISLVATINPTQSAGVQHFTEYRNKLYFSADDGTHGAELWSCDGTNVTLYDTWNLPGAGIMPSNLTVWNNSIYMSAHNMGTNIELYKFTDTSTLSIQSLNFNGSVAIFPNPVAEVLTIKLSVPAQEMVEVSISDITGREIYRSGLKHIDRHAVWQIPFGETAAGVYLCSIRNAEGKLYRQERIVKQ